MMRLFIWEKSLNFTMIQNIGCVTKAINNYSWIPSASGYQERARGRSGASIP